MDVTAAGSVEWHEQDAAGEGLRKMTPRLVRSRVTFGSTCHSARTGVLAHVSMLCASVINTLTLTTALSGEVSATGKRRMQALGQP